MTRRSNPRRPPKQWMRDCVAGASDSAADPGAVCGALWYRKMSPAAKRAALAREGRDNPSEYMNWLRDVQRRVGAELARASERYLQGLFVSGESASSAAEKVSRRANPAWARVFG